MQIVASGHPAPDVTAKRRLVPPADWTGLAVYLYGAIGALIATIVIYHGLSANAGTIDLNGFGYLSRNIAMGKGFTLGFGPTLRRAPLYPLVAGAILTVFGNYQVGVPD